MFDGEYIWKYTHKAYDFSVLGNTPITFPIEWSRSKIPGFALRVSMPNYHGLSAYVVMSHVSARFFEPQVAGIGATPVGSQVFRIDHDEVFNQTTHLQYQPWKDGPWFSFNWRYDSGEVAGAVPCAGGNCANGPNGTDSVVDVSGITPDQLFEAGLFCGAVRATPTMPISPTGLCPASQYGSNLLKIPAAGTENDDHNPPRIAPRNLFDIAVGHDNLFHGDKYKWSARIAGGEHRQYRGTLQLSVDVQRYALCDAESDHRHYRISLLAPRTGRSPQRCRGIPESMLSGTTIRRRAIIATNEFHF
ncbi:MAG: hypothetical protein WDO73_23575 [Ignavibacteriota bacterium]